MKTERKTRKDRAIIANADPVALRHALNYERMRIALAGAVEALEYAQQHGLSNPAVNGHRVLAERLNEAKNALGETP